MAQNLQKYHVPICAKKKVFPTFGKFFGKFTNA